MRSFEIKQRCVREEKTLNQYLLDNYKNIKSADIFLNYRKYLRVAFMNDVFY